MHARSWLAALGIALGTACTYIGQGAYNAQLCNVDEDADGVPELDCTEDGVSAGIKDCDDHDPTIYLDAAEVPYDGIDQDCDGLETVDVDGDGWPGITEADLGATGGTAAWPSDVAPERDCDDSNPDTHPGASDAFYDGVDADCAGDDDFDADLDGWVPAVESSGYTGPLPIGDCDDNRADVNPDVPAADDVWYDGTDQDCRGDNDFDQDGDSWMPDNPYVGTLTDEEWVGLVNEYMSFYGYDYQVEGRFGDCRDAGDDNLTAASLGPADVFPAAPDSPYDAVDADCAGDNDFDADRDRWMPDEATYGALFDAFVLAWDFDADAAAWGDCNDVAADEHPEANEIFGDLIDQDCDGGPDTAPFAFGAFTWQDPFGVSLGRVDDRTVLVTGAADLVDADGGADGAWRLFEIHFAPDAGFNAEKERHDKLVAASSDVRPISPGFDTYFLDDRFFVAASFVTSPPEEVATWFSVTESVWDSGTARFSEASAPVFTLSDDDATYTYADADLVAANDDVFWAAACGDGALQALAVDRNDHSVIVQASRLGGVADTCAFSSAEATTADLWTCAGGCTEVRIVDDGSVINQPPPGVSATSLDSDDGAVLRVEPLAGLTIDDGVDPLFVLADHHLSRADVAWWDGLLFVAGSTDDLDGDALADVVFAWGDPAGALTEVVWPLGDALGTRWSAEHVAVHVDDDHVVLAVSGVASGGGPDVVAWVFLEQGL